MTNNMQDHDLLAIPLLRKVSRLEPILKGYSSDSKWIAYLRDGRAKYIVRTYDAAEDERKRQEYGRLKLLEEYGVNCSRPVTVGLLPEQQLGYMIVTYIEGNEAAAELPLLTEREQYEIGVEAGQELSRINRIPCPEAMPSWQERMASKHARYRAEYAACGMRIQGEERVLAYIDEHLGLMKDRPNRFQHDDYHPRNLIVRDGKLAGVIDFNRYDWGDPVHEFVKVGMFSSEVSVPFSAGQIHGYHQGSDPGMEFWRLYSLYLAMTMISSIVWVLKVQPDEAGSMLDRIQTVLEEHDGMERVVPRWYLEAEQ